MRPGEFWPMTPREIADMARGAKWRDRREWERAAWVVAHVMSPHTGKKTPSMKKLLAFLGPDEDAVVDRATKATGPKDKTPEGIQAFIDEIARKQKPHAWAHISDKYAPSDKER
jgi:hypothetical protein